MKTRSKRFAVASIFGVLVLAAGAGCKSMPKLKYKPHWPWAAKAAPVEPQANQIAWEAVEGSSATEFPQSWARITLIINMTGATGAGSVRMHAKASMGWPVRMTLRVKPGSIASVEIQGEQRVLIPVLTSNASSVDLPLGRGVYSPGTPTITLAWR